MATPIDILAAQYNLSPEAAASLAQQYGPAGMSVQPAPQPPPAAPPPPPADYTPAGVQASPVPQSNGENILQGIYGAIKGSAPQVAPEPPPPANPLEAFGRMGNALVSGVKNISNMSPEEIQAKLVQNSGGKVVPNPDRVQTPYGGVDPNGPPSLVKIANAGFSPSTRGGLVTRGMSEKELAEPKAAGEEYLDAEQRAQRSAGVLAQQQAVADVNYKVKYAEEMQKKAEEQQINEANRRAFVQDQEARLNSFVSQISRSEDPDAVWGSGASGVVAKIGASLAVAAGAFGSAFTHGPNFAKEVIDGEINRSIQAQRESAANARAGFESQSNLYAKGLQEFKDRDMANVAARLGMLSATMAELDKETAKNGLDDKKNLIVQQLRSQYEKEAMDLKTRWAVMAHSQYQETYQDKYHDAQYATVGGGAAGGGGKHGGKGGGGDLVPGYGQAQSEKDARELNKELSFNEQTLAKLSELKRVLKKAKEVSSFSWKTILPGYVDDLGVLQNRAAQLQAEVVERTAKARGIKKFDKHTQEQIARSLGIDGVDSLRLSSDSKIDRKLEAIEYAKEQLRQNADIEARQFGVRSGGEYYDPSTGKPYTKLEGRTPQPLMRSRSANYADDDVDIRRGEDEDEGD